MSPVLSRRSFLKLALGAAAAGVIVPAWTPPRAPYVERDWFVDYIGPRPGGFIGTARVLAIEEWDRIGYPVVLQDPTYMFSSHRPLLTDRIYDFDLCILREEVPQGFWGDPANDTYPNVHTYVRTKRFGETIAEAITRLNFTGIRA